MSQTAYEWHEVKDPTLLNKHIFSCNKVKTILVNDRKICIVRLESGFFALDDRCPHANGSLGMGWCENEEVVCPVHRYKFNVHNGQNTNGENFTVNTYPVKIAHEKIFIGFPGTKFWGF